MLEYNEVEVEIMNVIDQKIEHLKYLYEKRIAHNQEIVEQIEIIKEEQNNDLVLEDCKSKLEKINKKISKRKNFPLIGGAFLGLVLMWIFMQLCGNVINPYLNSLMPPIDGIIEEMTFSPVFFLALPEPFIAIALLFGPPFLLPRIATKSKKYKELMQEKTNLTSQIQLEENKIKRLQDHLTKSNLEVERLQQLTQDCERERETLIDNLYQQELNQIREQIWQKYIPSQTDINQFNQIHEHSKKGQQKVLK